MIASAPKDEKSTKPVRPFQRVAVLGAGTMGSQIAAHCANAGLQVLLLDMKAKEGPANATVERLFKNARKMRPSPFFSEAAASRIRLGNFDDDFARIATCDWVIEVVVERMDIKRSIMARVEEHAAKDAVVSTNTSGLPIAEIAEGRSSAFRRRFLGTHFFNPPRYLKLLELIPTADTDPDVLQRVASFGRVHLGKGIVVAKDRPYFIGNRIGIYGMLGAIREFVDGRYTIEEVDALTGPLVGRPRSATFRTADVVGLDVMQHVIDNLRRAVPEDESVDAFQTPDVLKSLVENGALGAKTRAGFYKKDGGVIKSIDPATGNYREPADMDLNLSGIKAQSGLADRVRALYEDNRRAGDFFRRTTHDLLAYAARRIPEVTDSPGDVDRAIRWGFGWEAGPFELWDMIGVDRVVADMTASGIAVADWVREMLASGRTSFYVEIEDARTVYIPEEQAAAAESVPADELSLASVRSKSTGTLWENDETSLLDLGDGVALLEFRSKANTLGSTVIEGINEAISRVESDGNLRGLVIGNEGQNFSVGANLGEVAMALAMDQFALVEKAVDAFQQTIQRIRYAEKPVVVATHQRVLGGGCEMAMACPFTVAAAETYIGLVELGVGLIPAGTGSMRIAAAAHDAAPNGHDSEIQANLQKAFGTVAMATVATSAVEGRELGFLPRTGTIVMNSDRRFHVAKARVVELSTSGYLPPPRLNRIKVLGRSGAAALTAGAYQFLQGGFISEYDFRLARDLARVLTGGDLSGAQFVDEDFLLGLEKEVFLQLLGEEKTRERITHLLSTNKPLRN